jgi:hypothetical protein
MQTGWASSFLGLFTSLMSNSKSTFTIKKSTFTIVHETVSKRIRIKDKVQKYDANNKKRNKKNFFAMMTRIF